MTLTNCYLTVQELQDILRDQLTAFDSEYERAISSASRQIDDYCGRHFYATSSATAKTYRPTCSSEVWTADISTTVGLIVKTDDDDDGTYETTWTISTDFILEPFDRMNGARPYERIAAVGSLLFPTGATSRRPRVQVTATWGWPAVPGEIKSACAILAVDHFKSKELTNIASQYGTGTRFVRDRNAANFGRTHFSRIRAPIFNPEAESLLQPLRVVVVA